MKGRYIVFEGIDGSGKTSICSEISESLIQCGYKVLQISEPSCSEIGLLLRNQMKDLHINQTSLALLYAADSYDLQERIEDCYDFIISDRNYLSTVAYQMMAVDKEWLLMLHQFLKQPDMVFISMLLLKLPWRGSKLVTVAWIFLKLLKVYLKLKVITKK